MGQTKSIIEHNYDQTDKAIQISDEFKEQHWNSDRKDGSTNYWIGKNKQISAQIKSNEWPVNDASTGLKVGSHFYNIFGKDKKYTYNADDEEWLNKVLPPQGLDYFVKSWENLLRSAEKITHKSNQSGGGGGVLGLFSSETPKGSPKLNLDEGTEIDLTDLKSHFNHLKEDQMLVTEARYSNDDTLHEIESSFTLTSDLSVVMDKIKQYWDDGLEMLPEGKFPMVEQINDDKLMLSVKAPEGGYSLAVSNISDENWKELTELMKEEKIIDDEDDNDDENGNNNDKKDDNNDKNDDNNDGNDDDNKDENGDENGDNNDENDDDNNDENDDDNDGGNDDDNDNNDDDDENKLKTGN